MNVKEKFFQQLVSAFSTRQNGFTAAECLTLLAVKRNVISHYLNRLCEDNLLSKDNSRPVRFYFQHAGSSAGAPSLPDNDSLSRQMALCRAAVDYPPNGLALLLTGESGTGKSYLASRLYDYAREQNLIAGDIPLVELNCADYANNPELLSSTLFGHCKGAYTGAATDREGLLDNANGGMLFLDEVHRLSAENQEKLFLFMDKGYFYRLGDNKQPRSAKVRFIFATTEDVDNVLLRTLRRRIPVTVHLPAWHKRTRRERSALIEFFLRQEARQLNCDIRLDSAIFNAWLSGEFAGNIGEVGNQIKVMCATAWTAQRNESLLTLSGEGRPRDAEYLSWTVHRDALYSELPVNSVLNSAFEHYAASLDAGPFINALEAWLADSEAETPSSLCGSVWQIVGQVLDDLTERWGFTLPQALRVALGLIVEDAAQEPIDATAVPAHRPHSARARLMAQEFTDAVSAVLELPQLESAAVLCAGLFTRYDNPQAKSQGIIVTHGKSTASSIAALVNQLSGGYYFKAFDMPWLTGTDTIIATLKKHFSRLHDDSGVLILVDMGSLKEIWHGIHQEVKGDLVVINNVTTLLALDLAEKMQEGLPLTDITTAIPGRYENEIRYYAGAPARGALIVACISGEGIARKLQDIFTHRLAEANIDVITMEYDALRRALKDNSPLADIRLIITTTDLDTGDIPSLTIRSIIHENAQSLRQRYFSEWLDDAACSDVIQQVVELFTFEGISSRLNFLNPRVVLEDIENIIRRYEQDYHFRFENYLHINLAMHIALMTERLMMNGGYTHRDGEALNDHQLKFIAQYNRYFQAFSEKYHITIPLTEMLFIDEILASVRPTYNTSSV